LICRICSDHENAEKRIKRAFKAGHIDSNAHKEALKALNAKNSMSADLQPGAKAVPLSFVDMLGAHPETPLEPSRRPPSPSKNPFFEVMQYDDGFFDNNGQRISFSAGKLQDHDRIERTEIQQQIDRLALLPDHSKLGQFSQELEDELEPESTVDGAFAAAMRRMGKNLLPCIASRFTTLI
jgi:hypothetical protein